MIYRTIIEEMKTWKENKENKCLMIRGARQVGKTYIIRYFGKREYNAFFELNFLESP